MSFRIRCYKDIMYLADENEVIAEQDLYSLVPIVTTLHYWHTNYVINCDFANSLTYVLECRHEVLGIPKNYTVLPQATESQKMMILKCRKSGGVEIGENVRIEVRSIHKSFVVLGVTAPKEVKIKRIKVDKKG